MASWAGYCAAIEQNASREGRYSGFCLSNEQLWVVADPVLPDNPNHANITGWPVDNRLRK